MGVLVVVVVEDERRLFWSKRWEVQLSHTHTNTHTLCTYLSMDKKKSLDTAWDNNERCSSTFIISKGCGVPGASLVCTIHVNMSIHHSCQSLWAINVSCAFLHKVLTALLHVSMIYIHHILVRPSSRLCKLTTRLRLLKQTGRHLNPTTISKREEGVYQSNLQLHTIGFWKREA